MSEEHEGKKSYLELQKQIAALQQEADALLQAERAQVIVEINKKIAEYKITAQELQFPGKSAEKKSKSKTSKVPGEPKFRNPETEVTWTGKGKTPKWIKDHEEGGGSREDFLINKP